MIPTSAKNAELLIMPNVGENQVIAPFMDARQGPTTDFHLRK
jgi:hypothetical protein